ncbi:MAG: DUF4357 domain-containing protein [Bacteroidia bacterium]|nr:DUF4357 domain-containing protein [Bacteroidia bacterium]MDW8015634.1 DUF4357 domain-containing protein [Bacteroidia bacterium]
MPDMYPETFVRVKVRNGRSYIHLEIKGRDGEGVFFTSRSWMYLPPQKGVYLLWGSNLDEDRVSVPYVAMVGRSRDVRQRLQKEAAQKSFWQEGFAFLSERFVAHELEYLEIKLAHIVERTGKAKFLPTPSIFYTVNRDEEENLQEYFQTIQVFFEILRVDFFKEIQIRGDSSASKRNGGGPMYQRPGPYYFLPEEGIPVHIWLDWGQTAHGRFYPTVEWDLTGQLREGTIYILQGSLAKKVRASLCEEVEQHRQFLLEKGVLKDRGTTYEFMQDVGPLPVSFAASLVLGRNANGWLEWTDENGIILNELIQKPAFTPEIGEVSV